MYAAGTSTASVTSHLTATVQPDRHVAARRRYKRKTKHTFTSPACNMRAKQLEGAPHTLNEQGTVPQKAVASTWRHSPTTPTS